MPSCNRREFLKSVITSCTIVSSLPLISQNILAQDEKKSEPEQQENPQNNNKAEKLQNTVAIAEGDAPKEITKSVIKALGGMSLFVKKGNTVVVKPNIAWDKSPEYAANTNPEVVAAVIEECLTAGAKEVKVFDRSCNPAQQTYKKTGIADAAKAAGAKVIFVDQNGVKGFVETEFPSGVKIKKWLIYEEAFKCDVLINIPIAKHHGLARLTLCMKNLMGFCGGNRGKIHEDIHDKLCDIYTVIKPTLNILDAFKILIDKGPQGGRLEDVKLTKKVIAGVNAVSVDAYATTLFSTYPQFKDIKPADIVYLKKASERKLGEIDLEKLHIIKC
ncbi:MAG: DUF362 domain-containing protein [Planctomycetota bacterium]